MNKLKKSIGILGVATALALGGTVVSATPFAPATQKAEAASYTSCYWAMDGGYYCYRYACAYFEKVALGCRDGWVLRSRWYA